MRHAHILKLLNDPSFEVFRLIIGKVHCQQGVCGRCRPRSFSSRWRRLQRAKAQDLDFNLLIDFEVGARMMTVKRDYRKCSSHKSCWTSATEHSIAFF